MADTTFDEVKRKLTSVASNEDILWMSTSIIKAYSIEAAFSQRCSLAAFHSTEEDWSVNSLSKAKTLWGVPPQVPSTENGLKSHHMSWFDILLSQVMVKRSYLNELL